MSVFTLVREKKGVCGFGWVESWEKRIWEKVRMGSAGVCMHLVTLPDILLRQSLPVDYFQHTIALDWTQIHQEILETSILF